MTMAITDMVVMEVMVDMITAVMDILTMAGKGTAAGRANAGGNRRGTNRTEMTGRNFAPDQDSVGPSAWNGSWN